MRALLLAIALWAGLSAAQAAQPGPQANSTVAMATPGELHAQLVTHGAMAPTPRATHGTQVAAIGTASLQTSGAPGHTTPESEHRPTSAAMLLAAFALMTGIALRRWGAGQQ